MYVMAIIFIGSALDIHRKHMMNLRMGQPKADDPKLILFLLVFGSLGLSAAIAITLTL
jgi:hypothetical protein